MRCGALPWRPAALYASSAAATARSPIAWVAHWNPARAKRATTSA